MALQKYVCTKKCYHGPPPVKGVAKPWRVYEIGDEEVFDPETEIVPIHFKPPAQIDPVDQAAEQRRFEQSVAKGVKAPIDLEALQRQEETTEPGAPDRPGSIVKPPLSATSMEQIAAEEKAKK